MLRAVASTVQAIRDSVTVNLQTPGVEYVPLPLHGGLLGLGREIELPPKPDGEKTVILLVAVHGWGILKSTSIETSNEMLVRARDQFLSVSPKLKIYERSIGSDGLIEQRVEHCFGVLDQEVALVQSVDMVFFIGHSQGCPVSMMTLARLLEAKKLKGKQFGLIAFAGIHQGTIETYASMSIMRDATNQLYHMNDPSYELSRQYRRAVALVVGCGGRVMAFHSYGDNVVSCISSTLFGILPAHGNLAVGLYIPHYLASQWHNGTDPDTDHPDLMMTLIALWLKARNCGHKWDPRWARILREATSYSEGLGTTMANTVGNYLNTLDVNVTINMAHCELYTSSLLYLYAAYWMLQPTLPVATSIPATQPRGTDDPVVPESLSDFVIRELQLVGESLEPVTAEVTSWLKAFDEFLKGNGGKHAEFAAGWKRMQFGWDKNE